MIVFMFVSYVFFYCSGAPRDLHFLTHSFPTRLSSDLLLALVLASAGLLAAFWHLGKPLRAWRAFSQWRTSWLSREGVAAVLTYVPALLFAASLQIGRAHV